MAEESCNQNNDILVRAEIRRSGEEREEGAGVPRVRDNYTGLSSPSLPVTPSLKSQWVSCLMENEVPKRKDDLGRM